MLCLSGFELYSRWVPLLRERAVTSLEVRDQTTNWYSKGLLNFGSNSVYSSADQTAITRLGHGEIIDDVIGHVIEKSGQSNLLIYDFYNH